MTIASLPKPRKPVVLPPGWICP